MHVAYLPSTLRDLEDVVLVDRVFDRLADQYVREGRLGLRVDAQKLCFDKLGNVRTSLDHRGSPTTDWYSTSRNSYTREVKRSGFNLFEGDGRVNARSDVDSVEQGLAGLPSIPNESQGLTGDSRLQQVRSAAYGRL